MMEREIKQRVKNQIWKGKKKWKSMLLSKCTVCGSKKWDLLTTKKLVDY